MYDRYFGTGLDERNGYPVFHGPYLNQSLHPNEIPCGEARPAPVYLALYYGAAALCLLFGLTYHGMILRVIAFIFALRLVINPLNVQFLMQFGFTDERIIGQAGAFNAFSIDAPLDKINNVVIQRNFWGYLFGYATVKVQTSSGWYSCPAVGNAEAFKNALMAETEMYKSNKYMSPARLLQREMRDNDDWWS